MARKKKKNSTKGSTGAKRKETVQKEVNGKIIDSKNPDMSQVKYTKKQIGYRKLFSQAAEYAQAIVNDPGQTAAYRKKIHNDKRKRGTSVYHTALKDFMAQHSQKVPESIVRITFRKYQEKYQLSEREAKAVKYLIAQQTLTNAMYRQLNKISRITATRDLQQLVQRGILTPPVTKGAGALYSLVPLGNIQ